MSVGVVPSFVTNSVDVRLGDGIIVETADIGTIALDSRQPSGDLAIISHAHGDHLPDRIGTVQILCSSLTRRLAAVRRDLPESDPATHPSVTLLPAGHVKGSRAALIDDAGSRILYTGDIATRDRYGLTGFDPPPADVLIIEATYGSPEYVFPSIDTVEGEVLEWLTETADRPAILFGYALGKAQRIQRLVERADRKRVFTTGAILAVNDVITATTGESFLARPFDRKQSLDAGDVLVLPSQLARFEWVDQLVDETTAVTAGFSGWAADDGFIYQRGLDRGFVLSDHCDFNELVEVVDTVNPDIVYTQHGFASVFATELTRRGFEARALRTNQSTLDSF